MPHKLILDGIDIYRVFTLEIIVIKCYKILVITKILNYKYQCNINNRKKLKYLCNMNI